MCPGTNRIRAKNTPGQPGQKSFTATKHLPQKAFRQPQSMQQKLPGQNAPAAKNYPDKNATPQKRLKKQKKQSGTAENGTAAAALPAAPATARLQELKRLSSRQGPGFNFRESAKTKRINNPKNYWHYTRNRHKLCFFVTLQGFCQDPAPESSKAPAEQHGALFG